MLIKGRCALCIPVFFCFWWFCRALEAGCGALDCKGDIEVATGVIDIGGVSECAGGRGGECGVAGFARIRIVSSG